MNILDVAENAVRAGASLVEISLRQDSSENRLLLTIADNGSGMDAETLRRVVDPFYTTRTTRKVGLGVPFLKMASEMAGGSFSIESSLGEGTTVAASFQADHIDLAPLGDIGSTISALVAGSPDIDFIFLYQKDGAAFSFDTRQARDILGDVPLSDASVALFVRDHVSEGVAEAQCGITGG